MDHPWLRTGPLLVQVDGRRLAAGGSLVFHFPHAHDTRDTVSDRTADTAHSLTALTLTGYESSGPQYTSSSCAIADATGKIRENATGHQHGSAYQDMIFI